MSVLPGVLLLAACTVAPLAVAAPSTNDMRQQQWQRLSQSTDRDNVTAAVWLALPPISGGALPDGFDAFEQRAAQRYASDPQVLFALATVCQQVEKHCSDSRYHDALVRVEPQNAVNWLLLPDHGAPNAEQLHAASTAHYADSNLRTTLRVVRTALSGSDPKTVGEIAAAVPLPEFRGFVKICKSAADAPVAPCTAIAKQFVDDRSGTLLTRMIASATLQRMMKGTPDDVAAKQMRRDYVWLGDQDKTLLPEDQGRWQEAIIRYGEWDAMLRAADSAGIARTPPAGWAPKDPQSLLISEERTPAK
ncbi:MAG TPA: hypothetical protein VH082_02170 [Rudaea sp.]|jgi:hypothetical protein|nr:hypothetical protein [Rudaea sp.]